MKKTFCLKTSSNGLTRSKKNKKLSSKIPTLTPLYEVNEGEKQQKMRDIKLRIRLKSKSDGKEITLFNSVFDAMTGIAFYSIDRSMWEFISSDEYTGLKDKNGKEIYEGDLMRSEKEIIYQISWSNSRTGFVAKTYNKFKKWETKDNGAKPAQTKWIHKSMLYAIEKLVVAGNIYENPDLLK